MLPETLTLKSFLSYRDKQVLDFTKFHVALVTGENGHGKSSILDAITFALFSMARGVEGNKRGLRDLVSNGDAFLNVSLQFLQDGNRYRLVRTYDSTKNSSNVFLQLEKNGDFVNISENTIRETDKKIENIIHMNYETFITSSFIMQGRSDYFTAKKPTDRIEILREMLNLWIYEKARERVKEKLRETEFEIKELSKKVLEGKEEVKKIPEIEALFKDKEEKIKETRLAIDKLNQEIEAVRKKISEKDKLQNERKYVEQDIDKIDENLKQKVKQEVESKRFLDRISEVLRREREIEESYKELTVIKKLYEEMLEKSNIYQKLVSDKNKIVTDVEKTISVKKERVKSLRLSLKELEDDIVNTQLKIKSEELLGKDGIEQLEKLKVEKENLGKTFDEINIRKEEILNQIKEKEKFEQRLKEFQSMKEERIKNINREIREKEGNYEAIKNKIKDSDFKILESSLEEEETGYRTIKSMLEVYEEQFKQLNDKRNLLNMYINNLERLVRELYEKLEIISEESEDKCPLCGSPLSSERKEEIKKNYNIELEKNKNEFSFKKESLKKLEEEISSLKVVKREEVENAFKKVEETRSEILRRKAIVYEFEKEKSKLASDLLLLKEAIQKEVFVQAELDEIKNIDDNLEKFVDIESRRDKIIEESNKIEKDIENAGKKINEQNLNISICKNKIMNLKENLSSFVQKKEEIEKEEASVENELASKDFMKDEYQKISDLEKAISDIGFDQELLKQMKIRKDQLSKYEKEFLELSEASAKKEELEKNLAHIRDEKTELQRLKSKNVERLLDIDRQLEQFKGIDESLKVHKKDLELVSKYLEKILDEKIRLEEQHKKLVELKEAVSDNEKKIKEYEKGKGILNVCDDMFGKEGIPVAVIRSVLPQIEMLSNDLLLRMTNGNMQIKFSTIKSGKSGDKNSFDIDVYDRGERRRYELFSGGEQFRINLAIRVGISLFLSSLSQASLEMLVIDEGLGSQDESGKDRIIKEISAIKDRFKKVLVITHLGDIKESFEYEIRVVKDSHTSKLYVV